MPPAQKHRPIPRRRTTEMMSRGVTLRVRFVLHNPAGHSPLGRFAYDQLAQQESRQRDGVDWQLGALQRSEDKLFASNIHFVPFGNPHGPRGSLTKVDTNAASPAQHR